MAPPKEAPPPKGPEADFVSSLLDEIDWDDLSLHESWIDETKDEG